MKLIALYILLFIIVGCDNVEKKYFLNGKLMSERNISIINNDTIYEGLSTFYYNNGEKEAEIWFSDNKKNGVEILFHRNGKIKAKVYNYDGKTSGLGLWFYENGNIQDSCFYKENESIGDRYLFYENGKLKTYLFYSRVDTGGAYLKISYNKEENPIGIEEYYLYDIEPYSKDYHIGDSISLNIHLPNPPKYKLNCGGVVYKDIINGNAEKMYELVKTDSKLSLFNFNYKFKDLGRYIFVLNFQIYNKDSVLENTRYIEIIIPSDTL